MAKKKSKRYKEFKERLKQNRYKYTRREYKDHKGGYYRGY